MLQRSQSLLPRWPAGARRPCPGRAADAAQSAGRRVQIHAGEDVAALTDKPGPGAKTAFLGAHENYYVEYATRSDAANEAEVHATGRITDILSGEAVLTYGRHGHHPRDTGPGPDTGARHHRRQDMTLHAGGLCADPAGMPHMLTRQGHQAALCGVQHSSVRAHGDHSFLPENKPAFRHRNDPGLRGSYPAAR